MSAVKQCINVAMQPSNWIWGVLYYCSRPILHIEQVFVSVIKQQKNQKFMQEDTIINYYNYINIDTLTTINAYICAYAYAYI
ncbi:MAG: hypothetical protein H3Z52_07810 [archaeon]|nr:hypothetical protein [archaeon]